MVLPYMIEFKFDYHSKAVCNEILLSSNHMICTKTYKKITAVDKISQNVEVYKNHSFNFPSKHDRFLLCTDSNLPPFTRAIICIKISFRGGTKIKFLIPYRFPVRPAIDVDECFRSLILF